MMKLFFAIFTVFFFLQANAYHFKDSAATIALDSSSSTTWTGAGPYSILAESNSTAHYFAFGTKDTSNASLRTDHVSIQTGSNSATSSTVRTGNIDINTGILLGASANEVTGGILITTGDNYGSNLSGAIQVFSGQGVGTGGSGDLSFGTGDVAGAFPAASGTIYLSTGIPQTGPSGGIQMTTGNPVDASSGGFLFGTGGVATLNQSGGFSFNAGPASDGDDSQGPMTISVTSFNLRSSSIESAPYTIYTRKLQTTNNTLTTIQTVGTDEDAIYYVDCKIIGRQSAGAGGSENDSGVYTISRTFKNNSGTLTATIAAVKVALVEDDILWDVDLDSSGTDIRVRAQGAANDTVQWRSNCTFNKDLE